MEREDSYLDMEEFGERLKHICKERQMSAAALKNQLGLASVQAVYMWFGGNRLPSMENLIAICRCLHVSMEVLLGMEPEGENMPESEYKGDNLPGSGLKRCIVSEWEPDRDKVPGSEQKEDVLQGLGWGGKALQQGDGGSDRMPRLTAYVKYLG